jgi:DnaK suppressor protein
MNYIDIDQFKKTLSQRFVSYATNSNSVMAHVSESRDSIPDFLDLATLQSEMEFTFTRLAREHVNKNSTLKALLKIERGVYGLCEECGEQIPLSRLKAIPDTSYCIACQTEIEQNQECVA